MEVYISDTSSKRYCNHTFHIVEATTISTWHICQDIELMFPNHRSIAHDWKAEQNYRTPPLGGPSQTTQDKTLLKLEGKGRDPAQGKLGRPWTIAPTTANSKSRFLLDHGTEIGKRRAGLATGWVPRREETYSAMTETFLYKNDYSIFLPRSI